MHKDFGGFFVGIQWNPVQAAVHGFHEIWAEICVNVCGKIQI